MCVWARARARMRVEFIKCHSKQQFLIHTVCILTGVAGGIEEVKKNQRKNGYRAIHLVESNILKQKIMQHFV
jgi:hypothetical protein